jgi:hypothetical protein
MQIDVPDGEVADRITILELKVERLASATKRTLAQAALDALIDAWNRHGRVPLTALEALPRLREVNARLWDVEEELRAAEQIGAFDDHFVQLARSVYQLNDERARLKGAIDERTGSVLREPKSYV